MGCNARKTNNKTYVSIDNEINHIPDEILVFLLVCYVGVK
jgi:hypothetical protein